MGKEEFDVNVSDGRNDRTYFTIVPCIVDDLTKDVYGPAVYRALLRLSGGRRDVKASERKLANKAKCSVGKVSGILKELTELGFIEKLGSKRDQNTGQLTRKYRIADVWARNMLQYESILGVASRRSGHEQGRSPHEQGRSPGEHYSSNSGSNLGKEDIGNKKGLTAQERQAWKEICGVWNSQPNLPTHKDGVLRAAQVHVRPRLHDGWLVDDITRAIENANKVVGDPTYWFNKVKSLSWFLKTEEGLWIERFLGDLAYFKAGKIGGGGKRATQYVGTRGAEIKKAMSDRLKRQAKASEEEFGNNDE